MAEKEMYVLPTRVTVDAVEEIKQELIALLHSPENCIEVSGHNVSVVDAAGLQLLISLYKSAASGKKQLVLKDPSVELCTVLAYSGADKVLLSGEES